MGEEYDNWLAKQNRISAYGGLPTDHVNMGLAETWAMEWHLENEKKIANATRLGNGEGWGIENVIFLVCLTTAVAVGYGAYKIVGYVFTEYAQPVIQSMSDAAEEVAAKGAAKIHKSSEAKRKLVEEKKKNELAVKVDYLSNLITTYSYKGLELNINGDDKESNIGRAIHSLSKTDDLAVVRVSKNSFVKDAYDCTAPQDRSKSFNHERLVGRGSVVIGIGDSTTRGLRGLRYWVLIPDSTNVGITSKSSNPKMCYAGVEDVYAKVLWKKKKVKQKNLIIGKRIHAKRRKKVIHSELRGAVL